MNEEKSTNPLIYVALLVIFFGWYSYTNLKEENQRLMDLAEEYQYALSQANENISDANLMISDAQSYAWSTYQEMGEILEGLEEIDEVSAP